VSEKSQNHNFRDKLSRYGHIHRIENAAGVGTPDINCCFSGHEHWIESKCLTDWPKTPNIPVRFKHPFGPVQRIWFRRRIEAGGFPLLYLGIEATQEIFFFDGKMSINCVDIPDGLTRSEMVRSALFYSNLGQFPALAVFGFLTTRESYGRFLTR
jgi:hypothetical protein